MKIYVFVCIFCIPIVRAAVSPHQDKVQHLTKCVVKIVQEWEYGSYVDIEDVTLLNVKDDFDLSAIHKMERLRVVSRTFSATGNLYNVAYIIVSENYNELNTGLSQATFDLYWNPRAQFIIILRKLETNGIEKIQNLLYQYNMFRTALISYKEYDYAIHMFNLTSNSCIQNERLAFVSWCSNYTGEKRLLSPVRKLNIKRCQFKFVSHNLWPFVNFDDTGKEGLEQYTIKLFKKYSKFVSTYEVYEKMDRFGNIPNDFARGMIKKVEKNEVEGFLGGYPAGTAPGGNFSYTYPLDIDNLFFVFAHANLLGQWEAVLRNSLSTCIVITVLFVIFSAAAVFLSIFSKGEMCSRDVLIVFGYILGRTCTKNNHSGLPQRLILLSLLMLAFMIPYVLQSCLYSVIYNPVRGFEPKQIEDAKGYTPIFFSEMYRNMGQDCGSRLNCLQQVKMSPNKSLFTILSGTVFKLYAWMATDEQCHLQVYMLKRSVGMVLRTVYLRRGSILLQHYNDFLFRIKAAGLPDKYLLDIYHTEWVKCKSIHKPLHSAINLKDVYGVFSILFVGYLVSAIVLVGERFFGARRVR